MVLADNNHKDNSKVEKKIWGSEENLNLILYKIIEGRSYLLPRASVRKSWSTPSHEFIAPKII